MVTRKRHLFCLARLWPQPRLRDSAGRARSATSYKTLSMLLFSALNKTSTQKAKKLRIKDLSALIAEPKGERWPSLTPVDNWRQQLEPKP